MIHVIASLLNCFDEDLFNCDNFMNYDSYIVEKVSNVEDEFAETGQQ